jgi:hypothetical protein
LIVLSKTHALGPGRLSPPDNPHMRFGFVFARQ